MNQPEDLFVINLSGQDQPGITAALMKKIMETRLELVDIGQSLTHGLLSLSAIVKKPKEISLNDLRSIFAETSSKVSMHLEVKALKGTYHATQLVDKYIISCVSLSEISPSFLHDVTAILAEEKVNIQRIDNPSQGKITSLDIYITTEEKNLNWDEIKNRLLILSNMHKTDLAILSDDVWRTNKRMIVFDMDSTLIQSEVIVEMAKRYGVGDKVHEITERAMNGEINFDESLKQRVMLLKGMPTDKLQGILDDIKLTEGVEEFISTVKKIGYKTAIISGGFDYFANAFKQRLNIDFSFSNQLEIKDGKLTGRVAGSIVNAEKKAMLLEMLAQQENIRLEQVVAIGDGANDLPMLAKAGLGIAFHAKDIVKKSAKQHMSHGPMTSILYFLGIPRNF